MTLYSFGWLTLIVFGLSNAWLKRSLRMSLDRLRLARFFCLGHVQARFLRNATDKHVSFHPAVRDHGSPKSKE